MSDERIGRWIQTHTGQRFWPLDARPEDFDILDIAQGLAMQCRFGGQCAEFYSVAQHSVLVSEICEEGDDDAAKRINALAGLLHDASEAYISDIPRPVKEHLPEFRTMEDGIWLSVQKRWGLCDENGKPLFDDPALWRADDIALATEKRDLLAVPLPWPGFDDVNRPLPQKVNAVGPDEAREMFLQRFQSLTL